MTFIASVVAKKGVAIIADSLVTSMKRVIEYDKFIDFLTTKAADTTIDGLALDIVELAGLFQTKPSHTKDYEEKLFKYDNYTAITTAGGAEINGKRIEYLVKEAIAVNKKNKGYTKKKIETKVKDFCEFLREQVRSHMGSRSEIAPTTFIISNYKKTTQTTSIYKVFVLPCKREDLAKEGFDCIIYKKIEDYNRVVCDGQSRTSERIIFGETDFFLEIAPKIIIKVLTDFKIPEESIPANYIEGFLKEARSILPKAFFDDMKFNKMAGLSLQQAVDLASLLMKIEMNIQKYTENIPTVGGVIKLAVIDEDGFKFISGNEIHKPENLH